MRTSAGGMPFLRAVGTLFSALCLLSGCGDIRIAGGASEVGNPAKAVTGGGDDGASGESEVTGFGISARGMPVRVIRESRSGTGDTSQAATESNGPDATPAAVLSAPDTGLPDPGAIRNPPDGDGAPDPGSRP